MYKRIISLMLLVAACSTQFDVFAMKRKRNDQNGPSNRKKRVLRQVGGSSFSSLNCGYIRACELMQLILQHYFEQCSDFEDISPLYLVCRSWNEAFRNGDQPNIGFLCMMLSQEFDYLTNENGDLSPRDLLCSIKGINLALNFFGHTIPRVRSEEELKELFYTRSGRWKKNDPYVLGTIISLLGGSLDSSLFPRITSIQDVASRYRGLGKEFRENDNYYQVLPIYFLSLLDNSFNIHECDSNGDTILFYITCTGEGEDIGKDVLLLHYMGKGVDPHLGSDRYGPPVLNKGCHRFSSLKAFVRGGFDVNRPVDETGATVVHLFGDVYVNHDSIAKALENSSKWAFELMDKFDWNVSDNNGKTFLHYILGGGFAHIFTPSPSKLKFASYAINQGADLTIENNDGETPVDLIDIFYEKYLIGCPEILKELLESFMHCVEQGQEIANPEVIGRVENMLADLQERMQEIENNLNEND